MYDRDGIVAPDAGVESDVSIANADGFAVRGVPARPKGGGMSSSGDHRIAMLGAIAGLGSIEGVAIEGADTAAISFPGFYELLDSVTRR